MPFSFIFFSLSLPWWYFRCSVCSVASVTSTIISNLWYAAFVFSNFISLQSFLFGTGIGQTPLNRITWMNQWCIELGLFCYTFWHALQSDPKKKNEKQLPRKRFIGNNRAENMKNVCADEGVLKFFILLPRSFEQTFAKLSKDEAEKKPKRKCVKIVFHFLKRLRAWKIVFNDFGDGIQWVTSRDFAKCSAKRLFSCQMSTRKLIYRKKAIPTIWNSVLLIATFEKVHRFQSGWFQSDWFLHDFPENGLWVCVFSVLNFS